MVSSSSHPWSSFRKVKSISYRDRILRLQKLEETRKQDSIRSPTFTHPPCGLSIRTDLESSSSFSIINQRNIHIRRQFGYSTTTDSWTSRSSSRWTRTETTPPLRNSNLHFQLGIIYGYPIYYSRIRPSLHHAFIRPIHQYHRSSRTLTRSCRI